MQTLRLHHPGGAVGTRWCRLIECVDDWVTQETGGVTTELIRLWERKLLFCSHEKVEQSWQTSIYLIYLTGLWFYVVMICFEVKPNKTNKQKIKLHFTDSDWVRFSVNLWQVLRLLFFFCNSWLRKFLKRRSVSLNKNSIIWGSNIYR